MKLNLANANFRLFSPDEFTSNRWDAVLDVTPRVSMAEIRESDSHLAHDGRVLEMLSEHQCQGWLEGYLLDRAPRIFQLLRGVYPRGRFDVQPACEMAQDLQ